MNSIDLIRWALQLSDGLTAKLVADMRNAPMTPSTPGGKAGDGNHPIWTLGHLCVIEGGIPEILFGENNPVEHWKPLFHMGTQCSSDASLCIASSISSSLTSTTSSTSRRIASTFAASGVRVASPSAIVSHVSVPTAWPAFHESAYDGARSLCTPTIFTFGEICFAASATPRTSAVSPIGA